MTTENSCLNCNHTNLQHGYEVRGNPCLEHNCKCPQYVGLPLKCVSCHTSDCLWWRYADPSRTNTRKRTMCFKCSHWHDFLPMRDVSVRVNGTHYMLGDEHTRSSRGFAGRAFRIRFCDGRPEVVTTNLWYQGPIPSHLLHLFPDNAAFIE